MEPREIYLAGKERRERDQEQRRRAAKVELLDSSTNMREFIERRKAFKLLVVEPDIPLDEMTMPDYMKMRDRQK